MNTVGRNTNLRRIALALIVALAAYVGIWAVFFPASFYESFPGFGLTWISTDGAFNEHLVRDVGSLYLGFGAAGLAAILSRSAAPRRAIGIGWSVFGVLHLGYHLLHLDGSALDRIGNVVSLGFSLVLGLILVLPARSAQTKRAEVAR